MSLSALAWGPGHPSIVTYDDAELLAYDSETEGPKWRLTMPRAVVGVALGDASGLDVGDAAAPFRTPAAVGAVLVLDDEGRLHAVDAAAGRRLGDVGPFGTPRALATSSVGASIAIAAGGKVHVWRKAARGEIALEATALAFSIDGATLAVATEQGIVKMFDVSAVERQEALSETASFDARGPVADLTQHPSGAWLVAGSRATLRIEGPGKETSLEKIPVGAKRIRFDAAGKRLAVQLSQRQVLVYEWPSLAVLMRIEYTDRPVRGVAFGSGNWLGVAMDHGDGNKIDVVTSAVHRTDTHPGRQHRSWSLYVEGAKKEPQLSAQDEDAVRRMHEPSPPSFGGGSGGFGRGGRIGIITIISLALLCLKICVRAGGSGSSYSSSYSSSSGYTPPSTCDRACAKERLERLRKACSSAAHACETDAAEAVSALAAGDCTKAQAAVERVPTEVANAPLIGIDQLVAKLGLREACESGDIQPPKKIHRPKLVRLVGPTLSESSEDIPAARPSEGEKPKAAWAAADGTLFVAGVTGTSSTVALHRRTPTGQWSLDFVSKASDANSDVEMFGRSATDVYAVVSGSLVHWDGKTWDSMTAPDGKLETVSATTKDVFVQVGEGSEGRVFRRTGKEWTKEKLPAGFTLRRVHGGGPLLWAVGWSNTKEAVAVRGADGTWSIKTPVLDAGTTPEIASIWVSPSGDPFIVTDEAILRGSNGGAKWNEDEVMVAGAIKAMWGRSSSDVYAASFSRLLHFDGKTWSGTTYMGKAAALTGTAKEVFVVRADD